MYLRLLLVLFFISNVCFAQIKQHQHKDLRSPKEIELEKVLSNMKDQFKNNYLFSKNDFYSVNVNSTINNIPFYFFKGISQLQEITPIDCESKYELNQEKTQAYKQAENSISKSERAPRGMVPFYLVSVFSKLENIYENYNFFYTKDFSYNLVKTKSSDAYYQLAFQSKNPKLPISGVIILDKKTYTPLSLKYNLTSEYTFEMSSDNLNYKKSIGYLARVKKEIVKIEFKRSGNQFLVSKYESEYEFKNEQNNELQPINGDSGYSKIAFELYPNEPKICKQSFNLSNLE